MSEQPIRVEIQGGTSRRRLVLAALIEHWPADLADLSPEKKAVTDAEIENFLRTITVEERQKAYRKYAGVFAKNADAALKRLHPPTPPSYGRIGSRAVDFREDQVSKGGTSVDPSEETPAQRGNREARALPKVTVVSEIKSSKPKS